MGFLRLAASRVNWRPRICVKKPFAFAKTLHGKGRNIYPDARKQIVSPFGAKITGPLLPLFHDYRQKPQESRLAIRPDSAPDVRITWRTRDAPGKKNRGEHCCSPLRDSMPD